jgi:hypothetical protein
VDINDCFSKNINSLKFYLPFGAVLFCTSIGTHNSRQHKKPYGTDGWNSCLKAYYYKPDVATKYEKGTVVSLLMFVTG